MKPLNSSEGAYNRAFSRYLQLTRKTEVTNEFLRSEKFEEHLRGLEVEKEGAEQVIHYCGVGSGTGVKDIFIFHQLRRIYPTHKIHALIIEPNGENFAQFKVHLHESSLLPSVELDWMKLDSNSARSSPSFQNRKFHLIVTMESLYYEKDLDQALEQYLEHLMFPGPRSLLFISLGRSLCGWNIIDRDFARRFGWNTTIASENVLQSLNKLQSKVQTLTSIDLPNEFPIDEVFDETSHDGDALLDFITHCAHFRYSASEDLKNQVLKRLQEPDITRVEVDPKTGIQRRLFDMSFTVILVTRKQ